MDAGLTSADLPPDLFRDSLVITEHSPLPMAAVEGATHIVRYGNPAFCRLMKLTLPQLVGKSFDELLPEKDLCVTLLDRVFRTGKPANHTEREEAKPHPVFWSYMMWPVHEADLVGIMIQVTETAKRHGDTVAMNEALVLGAVRQHELVDEARHLNADLRMEIKVRESITKDLAEQARELEEKARLLDLSHDAIIVRDMEGHIRYWNHGAEELYGWSRKEVLGKVSHILLQTEFPTSLEKMTEELHRTNRWIGELIHTARDGRRLTVLARKTLDRDSQGNPTAVLENISDITERKQAEEQLRESEERYRSLFSSMDEGFCIIEKVEGEAGGPVDFRYLEANPAFTGQSGLSDMIGKTIRQILPDEAEEWCLTYDAVLRTGEPTRFERALVAAGRALELYAFRVEDKTQRRVAVIFKDISERQRAAIASNRLASIVEFSEDAIISKDPNGIITSWNKGAENIFGYAAGEIVGTSILRLIPADRHDEAQQILETIHDGESMKHFETVRQTKDGRLIDISITASPIKDATGKVIGVSKVARDISERKRAQDVIRRFNVELETRVEQGTAELRTANEALRHQIALRLRMEQEILEISEHEKQRIGQDLHDDLGQRLVGSWMLSVALARNLASQSSPEGPAATRIADILEKALAMTRSLARGLHPVAPEQGGLIFALHDLAARISEMFQIDCRFESAVALFAGDNTTATHLYRIAQEAVSNGVKHGHATRVRISLTSNEEVISLTVKDDGIGIGLLDPNRQGMGLRIMHYRADMIGGALTVEKRKGSGTRVTCTLPTPNPPTSKAGSNVKKTARKVRAITVRKSAPR